ncbi:MAG: glycosyltransferase family 2 protein [bacterium]|nr:glycosyltransferase family 2 protein [bacterium]
MTKVTAVVPAHNEERYVGATVRSLLSVSEIGEVIVVDDGSGDATARQAGEAGARVVQLWPNRGKGKALEAGIGAAAGEVLLLVDADLGTEAAKARMLLPPVLAGEADLTVAVLPSPPGAGGWGLVRTAARWGVGLLAGVWLRAPLSGQRAVSRRDLESLLPLARGYGVEVGMTVDAIRRGLVVREVPVDISYRPTGNDLAGVLHRARQLGDVLAALGRRRRPE